MEKLAVIMPVYNEEGAIREVLEKWCTELERLGICFVIHAYNDGSKDGTLRILNNSAAAWPGKIVVHDKPNSGHGPTILKGYLENAGTADWLFQIDSDDEMGPESFHHLWDAREKYDFLVGQRDGRAQPVARKIISFVSRLAVRFFYGKSIWDVNTPYRLMRSETFRPIFAKIPVDTFAPNVLVSGCAAREGLRLYEIPVPHGDRKTGEVSIKKWKLLKAAFRSFNQTVLFAFKG